MLIETTTHSWYRDASTPMECIVNGLVEAVLQFGEKWSSAAGHRREVRQSCQGGHRGVKNIGGAE